MVGRLMVSTVKHAVLYPYQRIVVGNVLLDVIDERVSDIRVALAQRAGLTDSK